MGVLYSMHIGAEFRQAEPERDLPAKHTALARCIA
jgi:hypothetical protein